MLQVGQKDRVHGGSWGCRQSKIKDLFSRLDHIYISIKAEAPIEHIADLALDILEATKKVIRDPAAKKPVKVMVGQCI